MICFLGLMIKLMIKQINFSDIFPIWRSYLWPERQSKIESNSAMMFLSGYDIYNMNTNPTFFGYYLFDKLVGVNSGHMCNGLQYRSRGLYVFESYRGLGLGRELLLATIAQAKLENAKMIWSYPRKTSWKTYQNAGFRLVTDWEQSETSNSNAYCILNF